MPAFDASMTRAKNRMAEEDKASGARLSLMGNATKILGLKAVETDNKNFRINEYPDGGISHIDMTCDYFGSEANIELRVKKEALPGILKAIKGAMQ
jgi:hypothetical protein